MKSLKENKGITLIALIITIIVMLILVGVTVNVALNGGLFDVSKDAVKKTKIEADREILSPATIAALDKQDLKIKTLQSILDNLPEGWTGDGTGPYTCTSPNGNVFTVTVDGIITYVEDENQNGGGQGEGTANNPFTYGK